MNSQELYEERKNGIKELYFNPNAHLKYSNEDIYYFMNCISGEIFEQVPERHASIDFVCVLPPLYYKNTFIKGVAFTQAPDIIVKIFPEIKKLFHIISEPMLCNIPIQSSGDALFSLYENKEREAWFRKFFPKRKEIFIPLEDSDFIHEYIMQPHKEIAKDHDIIVVSRISEKKNLFLLAEALKCYRAKYKKDIKLLWITGREFDNQLNGLNDEEKSIIGQMLKIFNSDYQYVSMLGLVDYNDMPKQYARAKICVLTSLLEGKNRSIREAMSCNVPVLLFNDYIKYIRQEHDIIPNFENNAGKKVEEFSAEALADGIEFMLNNIDSFKARKTYLESHGRINFFNKVLDAFPYYKENIPNYEDEKAFNNKWLDLAICENYNISLNDFLYSRNAKLQAAKGLDNIWKLLEIYAKLFRNTI